MAGPTQSRATGRSTHITAAGAEALRRELDWLWRVKRPEVTQAVADAAALGDRSENAEYIYGKKQLREIDRRIRYLSKRLDEVTVVHDTPADTRRIYFGAWFELETESGEARRYRIVGSDEIDTGRGWISLDSPMAKAVLRKAVGDDVVVQTPRGKQIFAVTAIWYHDPDG
ncbi:transcription elongation factor GreB [Natronocella acetinitrilica]|uniref:Transcription elongation factor GreB n=1 Tax=Natronocella acetinitrilica TaxID=414046 RepID=A0AAE3G0J8_9GAMM|nr:transcription elongation factor GreB [Natronocella acetinitrilica]MCP1673149.1 transcription elongation factor GreB [Natronocella acetinitrilica]